MDIIINALPGILVTFISAVLGYVFGKHKENKANKLKIMEISYSSVYLPLYKMCIGDFANLNKEKIINTIEIFENTQYEFCSPYLLLHFHKYINDIYGKRNKYFKKIVQHIRTEYRREQKLLGYPTTNIISFFREEYLYQINCMLALLSFFIGYICFLVYFIFVQKENIFQIGMAFLVISIIWLIFIFICKFLVNQFYKIKNICIRNKKE